MATWASTGLPTQPLQDGLRHEIMPAYREFTPDEGPPRRLSKWTGVFDRYYCSYILTTAQWSTLETFYKTTLNNGVDSFTWLDPDDGSTAITAIIAEPPARNALPAPGYWRVNIVFQQVPS
jgi:hypothetical protein